MKVRNNSLKSSLASAEFRRRGGFSKAGIKIRVGEDVSFRETKCRLQADLETRRANKEDGISIPESGKFVTGRADLTKKVRMPKKDRAAKNRKIENSQARNHYDGIQAGRVGLNSVYEAYCKKYGFIEWKKFEKYQSGKTFQKRIATLGA